MDPNYLRTSWVNDVTPINADNLNHGEGQYAAALLASKIVSVADFRPAANGTTDDSAAFQAAIDSAPDGATVVVPGGMSYLIGQQLTCTQKNLTLSAYGANIIRGGDPTGRLFSASGGWDPTITITKVTSTVLSEAGQSVPAVVVEHSGRMSWQRGDVVKAFSDDQIPGVRDASNRTGQMFTVWQTDNGSTTLRGALRDPLTTKPRMARMQDWSVSILGGTYDVTDTLIANGASLEMFGFASLKGPVLRDVLVKRSLAQGVTFTSCYKYLADNFRVQWAWDDNSAHYGYGVNDNASSYGSVVNCHFAQVRHGFTDSNAGVAAGSDTPTVFGRSVGATIANCTVDGATTSGFDTHQGGEGHTFIGCTVYNSPVAFTARGRKHVFSNCKSINCASGYRIFTENSAGETWGISMASCIADGTTGTGLEITLYGGASHPKYGQRDSRSFDIRDFRITNSQGVGLSFLNATVRMPGFTVEHAGALPSVVNSFTNISLTGTQWREEFWNASGSGVTLYDCGTTVDSQISIDGLRLAGWSTMTSMLARVFRNTATTNLFVDRLRADYGPSIAWYTMTTANGWVDWETSTGVADSAAFLALTSATGDLSAVGKTRSPNIVLEFTISAANTLPKLPDPLRRGQVLKIINNTSSTANLGIGNGSTYNTTMSGSKTITPGQTLMLEASDFGSGKWRQLSTI